jgi:hypothetical protein
MFANQYISCRMVVFGFMLLFYLRPVNESLLLSHQGSMRHVTSFRNLQWDSLPIWPRQIKSERCFDYLVNFLHCSNLRQGQPCSENTVTFAPALKNPCCILDTSEMHSRMLVPIFSHMAGCFGKYTSFAGVTVSHVTIQGMSANFLRSSHNA